MVPGWHPWPWPSVMARSLILHRTTPVLLNASPLALLAPYATTIAVFPAPPRSSASRPKPALTNPCPHSLRRRQIVLALHVGIRGGGASGTPRQGAVAAMAQGVGGAAGRVCSRCRARCRVGAFPK